MSSPALVIEELTRLDELEGLHEEWSELCDQSPRCTPFQRPEWLIPWCRHRRQQGLWVLAVRREARLVGLAPFKLVPSPTVKRPDALPSRAVGVLGSAVSDYLDMVLAPRFARPVAATILAHLDTSDRWTHCEFRQLRPNAELLAAELPKNWSERRTPMGSAPALTLPARVESLSRVVPARQLKNLAQFRRRLTRQGTVRVTIADRTTCVEDFAELVRLHGLRWQQRSQPGGLHQPVILAFHREVVAGFARRKMLSLYLLHLDDRAIAGYYGFVEKKRAYFYLQGFDPDYAKWSPGVLVVGFAIEEAVRRGLETFDFLRGGEIYKYRWGAQDIPCRSRRLWRSPGTERPPSDAIEK